MSDAPPQSERIGVGSWSNLTCSFSYTFSMRASKRAGGSAKGVDIVMIAEMLLQGRSDAATMPPMEWPMTIILVLEGYRERI